jgi:hypothetical protein
MGTQNESNEAEPQNEFLSGFKIKDRAASQNDKEQQAFVNQAEAKEEGTVFNKASSQQQDSTDSNPYRLTQQMDKRVPFEQVGRDPVEKKTGFSCVQKLKSRFFQEKSESGDSRQKIMVILIPILFVIMIFMFRQVLVKPPQKSKGANSHDDSAKNVKKTSGDEIEWTIPEPLPIGTNTHTTSGHNTANNTGQGNSTVNVGDGAIYIQSIVYSPDKPSAVIGNKIVHLNQEINGAVIVEINEDNVVFERNGERWAQKVAEKVIREKMDQIN